MGSDGVYDRMTSEEIVEKVWKEANYDKNELFEKNGHDISATLVEKLIGETFRRKAWDNITVIMICFDGFIERIKKMLQKNINIYESMEIDSKASRELIYNEKNLKPVLNSCSLQENSIRREMKRLDDLGIQRQSMNDGGYDKENNKAGANAGSQGNNTKAVESKKRHEYITDKSFNERVLTDKGYNERVVIERCFNEKNYIDKNFVGNSDRKLLSKSENFKGIHSIITQKDLRII